VVDVGAPRGVAGRTSAPFVSSRVVLDTSVLISDPEAVFAFPTSAAVIPLTVVEELDSLKTRPDDVGRSAREVLRRIEVLRVENGGDIRSAVALPGGGTLQIETNGLLVDTLVAQGLDPAKADNRILAAALGQAHREVEPVAGQQQRRAGSREHAAEQRLAAGSGDTGRHGRLQHLPRLARVADHEHPGSGGADARGRGARERQRELRGQELAGDSTDTVGAEDPGVRAHRPISACCTAGPCGPSSDRPSCAP